MLWQVDTTVEIRFTDCLSFLCHRHRISSLSLSFRYPSKLHQIDSQPTSRDHRMVPQPSSSDQQHSKRDWKSSRCRVLFVLQVSDLEIEIEIWDQEDDPIDDEYRDSFLLLSYYLSSFCHSDGTQLSVRSMKNGPTISSLATSLASLRTKSLLKSSEPRLERSFKS